MKAAAVAAAATMALGGASASEPEASESETSATESESGELVIFNPGSDLMGPVVYDNVGHVLGVGERRTVPPLDSMGCYVLKHGWIIVKKGTAVCPPAGTAAQESAEGNGEQEPDGFDGGDTAAPEAAGSEERSGESVPA
jgi:hypothetical protein